MKTKLLKKYFQFSKQQQKGILALFFVIIVLQIISLLMDNYFVTEKNTENTQWLALQKEIDDLKNKKTTENTKIYPFNPNFISDYKGYKLGMSTQEIDRLFAFRKQNKYVNSAKEFQKVTLISDTLLAKIAPYFKFPDWVNQKKDNSQTIVFEGNNKNGFYKKSDFSKKQKIVVTDLNTATQADLVKVYGIGEVLSERILKFKNRIGQFVSIEQLDEVWGISPEALTELKKHFSILTLPNVEKLDINNANLKELASFPYFKYALAKEILIFRSKNGNFKNINDLNQIKGFPVEKSNIINLYLRF